MVSQIAIERVFCLSDEDIEEKIADGDMDDEVDEGLAEHEARSQRIADGLEEANIVAD